MRHGGMLGPRFIVSFEGQGLHKILSPKGLEPDTSCIPGKRRTIRPQHHIMIPGDSHQKIITHIELVVAL